MVSGFVVAADQLTKFLIVRSFSPGESLPLLGSILSLTYVQNTGAAFGLFKGQQGLFIVLAVAVMGWAAWHLWRGVPVQPLVRWGLSLVLGGAMGNLIDRIRLGHVVDFLDLHWWPVFNVGDSAITIGVFLLILQTIVPSLRRADRNADKR